MGTFYNEEAIKQREAAIQDGGGIPKTVQVLIVVVIIAVVIALGWWKITHNPDTMIVNINTASETELGYLPGVGKAHAEAIIRGRPYKTPEDLKKVPGIGEKSFERMKPRVKVE